jgi:hypothetical protein
MTPNALREGRIWSEAEGVAENASHSTQLLGA